ncbi:MAG: NRDE family protein [Gammaproteobacteria bacterium]|nr:NRDE family protein [Gammaproteobacteria bacterium]
MCLAAIAWNVHPRYRVIVIANRDEFHARESAALGPWAERSEILAGRDLQAGGTWFGIDRNRRMGLVTNYRELARPRRDAPTRGRLVSDFLGTQQEPAGYLEQLADDSPGYAGFNLLLADAQHLWYATNRAEPFARRLEPGVHVLSNHVLDTPWPKVRRLRAALESWLAAAPSPTKTPDPTPLWAALADRECARPSDLPQTGLSAEWELRLSAAFVQHGDYGTRCSTLLLLGHDGAVDIEERSFDMAGQPTAAANWRLRADEWA